MSDLSVIIGLAIIAAVLAAFGRYARQRSSSDDDQPYWTPSDDQSHRPTSVRSWASVFALVAVGMLALEAMAAVVVSSQYETIACESVNEPAWIDAFFRLVLATPILVPISIGFIWWCAARRDRAYLLWIVVLFGSVIPLVVLIVTNPFCPS